MSSRVVTDEELCRLADEANFAQGACAVAVDLLEHRDDMEHLCTVLRGAATHLSALAHTIESAGKELVAPAPIASSVRR